jgi:hypothetical protein
MLTKRKTASDWSQRIIRGKSWCVIFLLVTITGCGSAARVIDFKVRPNHVCSGDRVTITWNTAGETTTLSSNPVVEPPLGEVENEGSEERDVDETTTFRINVTAGDESDDDHETVEVVPPGGADFRFGTLGECVNGVPQWVVVTPPDEWSDRLTVNTVRNTSGRTITVAHINVAWALNPGDETASFAGQPVSGDWILSAIILPLDNPCPVPDGEGGFVEPGRRPDGTGRPPLPTLSISINAVCQ